MRVLYYDCFAGISGDMHLGAMIDLGIDAGYLKSELKKLNIEGYSLNIEKDQRKAIEGTRVDVILTHQHDHHHHHHDHHHRNFSDIKEIILKSGLSENVKRRSVKMFELVARAEAKIHGKSIDEVHFHEVGAIDSIVDTVGAAICIEKLGVDKIMASPVQLGGGFIKIAHGTFPVPAPATSEILKDIPVKTGVVEKEMTTPTGAAILAANVDEFSTDTNFKLLKTAYGIGQRDTEIPNVLRVYLGETADATQSDNFSVNNLMMTECNLDDLSPERYDYLMEQLLKDEALDVFMTPIQMKKNRPATLLSVLHNPDKENSIHEFLFHETTTLGIRTYMVKRKHLKRRTEEIQTKYGTIRVKHALWNDKILKSKPEYDDCIMAAQKNKISLNEVYNEVSRLLNT